MRPKATSKLLALVTDRDLIHTIEQHIHQRTRGGVHGLQVALSHDRLVLRGHTATYYIRQLALLAAEQVLGFSDPDLFEVSITVGAHSCESR